MAAAKGTEHVGTTKLGVPERYQSIQVTRQSSQRGVENPSGKHEKDERKRAKLSCGLFSEPQTDSAQAITYPPGDYQNRHPLEPYPLGATSQSTGVPSAAVSGMDSNTSTLPPLVQSEEADLAEPPSRRHRSRNPLKRLFSKSLSKLKHRSASQPPSPDRMSSSSEASGSHKLFKKSRSASQPPSPERGSFPPPHRGWFSSKSSKKGTSLPTTPTGKGYGESGSHTRRPSGYYYQVDVAPSLSPVPSWLPPQTAQSGSSGPSTRHAEDLPTTPRGASYGARGPPWSAPTTPQSHEVLQWSGPSTPTVTETPPSSGPSSPLPTGVLQWNSPGSPAGAESLTQSAESLTQGAESLTQGAKSRTGSVESIPPAPLNSSSQQSTWQMYGETTAVTSSPIRKVPVQGGRSPSLDDPLVFEVPVLGLLQERNEELPAKPSTFHVEQEPTGKEEAPSPISIMDRSGHESPSVQDGGTVYSPLEDISEEPVSQFPSEYEDANDSLRTEGSGVTDEAAGEAGVKDSQAAGGEECVHTGSNVVVTPVVEQTMNTSLGAYDETWAEPEREEPEESGARKVDLIEASELQNEKGFEPLEIKEHHVIGDWEKGTVAGIEQQNEEGQKSLEAEEQGRSRLREEGSVERSKLQTAVEALEFGRRHESGVRDDGSAEFFEPQNKAETSMAERGERGLREQRVLGFAEPQTKTYVETADFADDGDSSVRKEGRAEMLKPQEETKPKTNHSEVPGGSGGEAGGGFEAPEPQDETGLETNQSEKPGESGVKQEGVTETLEQSNETGNLGKRNESKEWKEETGTDSELMSKIVRSGHEGVGGAARVPVPASGEEEGAEEGGTGGAGGPVAEGEAEAVPVPKKTTLQEQGSEEGVSEDIHFERTHDESDDTHVTKGDNEDERQNPGRISAGIRELVTFFEAEASKLLGKHSTRQSNSPEKSKLLETEAGVETGVVSAPESAVPLETGTDQNGNQVKGIKSEQAASLEPDIGLSAGLPPLETGPVAAVPESAQPPETGTDQNGSPVDEVASQQAASVERESGLSVGAPPFEVGPIAAEPESAVPLETGTDQNGSSVEEVASQKAGFLKPETGLASDAPPFETKPVGAGPESAVPPGTGTDHNGSPLDEVAVQEAPSVERESGLSAVAPQLETVPEDEEAESVVPLESGTNHNGSPVEEVGPQQVASPEPEIGLSMNARRLETGLVVAEPESAVLLETGTDQNGSPIEEVGPQHIASLERDNGLSADVPPFEKGPEGPAAIAAGGLEAPQPAERAERAEPLRSVDLNFGCLLGAYRAQQMKQMPNVAPAAGQDASVESGVSERGILPVDSAASSGGGTWPEWMLPAAVRGKEERSGTVADGEGGVGPDWTGKDGELGANGMVRDGALSKSGTTEARNEGGMVEGEKHDGVGMQTGSVKGEKPNGAEGEEESETVGGEETSGALEKDVQSGMVGGERYRGTVGGETEGGRREEMGRVELDGIAEEGETSRDAGVEEKRGTDSGKEVAVKESAGDRNGGGFGATIAKEKVGSKDRKLIEEETGVDGNGNENGTSFAKRNGMAEGPGFVAETGSAEEGKSVTESGKAKENRTAEGNGNVGQSGTAEQSDASHQKAVEESGRANESGSAKADGTASEGGNAKEVGYSKESGNADGSDVADNTGVADEKGLVEESGIAGKSGTVGEDESTEAKGSADVKVTSVGQDGRQQQKETGAEDKPIGDGTEGGIEAEKKRIEFTGTEAGVGAENKPTEGTEKEDGNVMPNEKGAEEETGASVESGNGMPSGIVGANGIAREAALNPSCEAPAEAGLGAPRSGHVEDRKGRHVDSQEGQIGEMEEDVESTGATGGATKDDVIDDASSRRRRAVRWRDDVTTGAQNTGERVPDSDPGPARGRAPIEARPAQPPPHPVIQLLLVGGILGKAAVKTGVGLTYITLQQCGVLAKVTTNMVLDDAKGMVGTLAKQAGRVIGLEKRARLFG